MIARRLGARWLALGLLWAWVAPVASTATAADRASPAGTEGVTPPAATLAQLDWLAGHWTSADAEEFWMAPRGGVMLAVSREIRSVAVADAADAPRTRVSFEYLRIEQRDDTLVLQASPGGRPPTPFTLAALGARRVRFHNATHDFPQSISYWRAGSTLHARVEGVSGGKTLSLDYAWTLSAAGASP